MSKYATSSTNRKHVLDWITATGIALVIVVAGFIFSKWLEKKNYSQQQELLQRKKEKLREKAAGEADIDREKQNAQGL